MEKKYETIKFNVEHEYASVMRAIGHEAKSKGLKKSQKNYKENVESLY